MRRSRKIPETFHYSDVCNHFETMSDIFVITLPNDYSPYLRLHQIHLFRRPSSVLQAHKGHLTPFEARLQGVSFHRLTLSFRPGQGRELTRRTPRRKATARSALRMSLFDY